MTIIRGVAIVIAIAGSAACIHQVFGQGVSTVRGIVTDTNGGAIAGATVTFAGPGGRHAVHAGPDGRYAIDLAPGLYQPVATEAYWCDSPRAEFLSRPQEKLQLDFEMVLANMVMIHSVQTDLRDRPAPAQAERDYECYKTEQLAPIGNTGLRPLVLYGSREKQDRSVAYLGLKNRGNQYPAEFLFDQVVLKADRLDYSPGESTIKGAGHVMWQSSETTRRGSQIKVAFETGRFRADIAQ